MILSSLAYTALVLEVHLQLQMQVSQIGSLSAMAAGALSLPKIDGYVKKSVSALMSVSQSLKL